MGLRMAAPCQSWNQRCTRASHYNVHEGSMSLCGRSCVVCWFVFSYVGRFDKELRVSWSSRSCELDAVQVSAPTCSRRAYDLAVQPLLGV